MAMTPRGRTFAVATTFVVVAAVVAGVLVLGGRKGLGPLAQGNPGDTNGHGGKDAPIVCPLTGSKPAAGQVPDRPALAVKVENLPAARPQTGLSFADIIYEEPVEASITRFIVVYQCQDASRIEPVRSARLTDPGILVQYGHPLFGYAGGVQSVIKKVASSGLVDVNYIKAASAYHRDPARPMPHNLYTSTKELYAAGHVSAGAPSPVFTYSKQVPVTAVTAHQVHIPFSPYSDVYWRWSASRFEWLRSYGSVPATYSDGTQMGARNVVIQVVKIVTTGITDVNGVHSPEVISTGSGVAFVLRNGKMIKGTWSRPSSSDVTRFVDAKGDVIPLVPGKTWVELVPQAIHVTVG